MTARDLALALALTSAAADPTSSQSWWSDWGRELFASLSPFLSLLGVVVGALIGSYLQKSNTVRTETLREARQVAYDSLALIYSLRSSFNKLIANAPYGSTDPEADTRAAEAIGEIREKLSDMDRSRALLRVGLGALSANEFSQLATRSRDYMDEIGRQLDLDGVFRGAAATKWREDYDALIETYATHLYTALRATDAEK